MIPVEPFPAPSKPYLGKQASLLKMPITPLESVCAKYLATTLPLLDSEEEKAAATKSVDDFLSGDGPELFKLMAQYDEENDNFMEHFYREIYTGYKGSNYSLNPNFVLFPSEALDTGPKAAACLCMHALVYHAQVVDGSLPVGETRGKALCMRQAPWIFGTARVATPCPSEAGVGGSSVDEVRNFVATSRHVAVLCKGLIYKVTVLGADLSLAATTQVLEDRFTAITAHAKAMLGSGDGAVAPPLTGCIGALTTEERGVWAPLRAKLVASSDSTQSPKNAEAVACVDEALFVVCLDTVSGLSVEAMEKNVLYGVAGTFENRWLDKWSFVVCEDGQSGVNWEHSMLDGHTMMEFVANAVGDMAGVADPVTSNPSACTLEPMPVTVDEETQVAISAAVEKGKRLSDAVGVSVLEFKGFGSDFCKSKAKCSPDAFCQAALTLTHLEYMGRLASPYESVLTKAFKHGRVAVARNMSSAIADSAKSFAALPDKPAKAAAVRAICAEVSRVCRDAASAQEFDRPLMVMRNIAKVEGLVVNMAEQDPVGWGRLQDLGLCTSHCGRGPIRLFGFEPPSADGFAVGYYLTSTAGQFSVNHNDPVKAAGFTKALEAKLLELQGLFLD